MFFTALLATAVFAVPSTLGDDRLSVGDDAPALSIEYFVKGERVDSLPVGKVAIVEFWATWCGPCIKGFPHLSDLQEKYADDLIIISVSDEALSTVEPFLAKPKHANVTRYTVATDPDGSMHRDWMAAARLNSIPSAFLIDRDGVLQYIGHPAAMDAALERVITGEAAEAPSANELPGMSDEQRRAMMTVDSTHSEAASALLSNLQARLASPGRLSFEQTLTIPDALRMGGPGDEAADLTVTRKGELLMAGELGARLDATRNMVLPGMPGPMAEQESVIFSPERLLLRRTGESPFMQQSLPTDGWLTITRKEARQFARELPMPIPALAVMELNPVAADPLHVLSTLLDMCALEVESEVDGLVVLSGPAAPFVAMPRGPDPTPTRLRIEFSRTGPVTVATGPADAPSLTMVLAWSDHTDAPDPALFDPGSEEPTALLPVLQERLQGMRRMGSAGG
jgi:thiol-disulfide isomerase/thioredoxin